MIYPDQIVSMIDPFLENDTLQSTTNYGQIYVSTALDFFQGVISEPDGIVDQPLNGFVIYQSEATTQGAQVRINGALADSMVDGPVRKQGNQAFEFPTGDFSGTAYHLGTVAISDHQAESTVDAHYLWRDGHGDFGPGYGQKVSAVSPLEYWLVRGQEPLTLRFDYESDSAITDLIARVPEATLEHLTIVGWDGQAWQDLNATLDPNSSYDTGKLSVTGLIPSSYLAYTFGVGEPEPPAPIDSDNDCLLDPDEFDLNGDGLGPDDSDGDGIPNYLDPDDDNDGIPTRQEDWDGDCDPRNDDLNENGLPDYLDKNFPGVILAEVSKKVDNSSATVGDWQNWSVTYKNSSKIDLHNITLVDVLPGGFTPLERTFKRDDQRYPPTYLEWGKHPRPSAEMTRIRGLEVKNSGVVMTWPIDILPAGESIEISFDTMVGAGTRLGKYQNEAYIYGGWNRQELISNIGTAEIEVAPDAIFDCAGIIGKVFNDQNRNGYPDPGEPGMEAAEIVAIDGFKIKTDTYGRYNIGCRALPDDFRGSNFLMKLDVSSLPKGYEVTTENPRVIRLTRGKIAKVNFGVAPPSKITLEINDHAFEYGKYTFAPQWQRGVQKLTSILCERPNPILLVRYRTPLSRGQARKRLATAVESIKQSMRCGWGRVTLETELIRTTKVPKPPPLPAVSNEPGVLRLVPSETPATGPTEPHAYEILIDTSGSMLQPMGSGKRIDVARNTLKELVSTVLPEQTPFALRQFGLKRRSCDTRLFLPLEPLESQAVMLRLDELQSTNYAKTNIAETLNAVADDMAEAKGKRTIILITDGEETCGGDVTGAIKNLRGAGFELDMNIVGFAIESNAYREDLRAWATLGGGQYFDANNAKSLFESLKGLLDLPPVLHIYHAKTRKYLSTVRVDQPVRMYPGAYLALNPKSKKLVYVTVVAGKTTELTIAPDGAITGVFLDPEAPEASEKPASSETGQSTPETKK